MKRIVFVIVRNIIFVPAWFFKVWWYGKSEKYTETERYQVVKHVADRVVATGRIKVNVYGKENLPEDDGFIMFPNHQGHFDAIAFLNSMERPFSIVIKKESGQIIFLNQVITALRGLRMDHSDIRQSMRVIMQMAKEVKAGRNYLIFPEGKRTGVNDVVGFKPGSFKSATKAKCPIVPAALIDSHKVFDTNKVNYQTVQLHYLKPLYYEDYKGMKTTEITKIVEKRITDTIKKNGR